LTENVPFKGKKNVPLGKEGQKDGREKIGRTSQSSSVV